MKLLRYVFRLLSLALALYAAIETFRLAEAWRAFHEDLRTLREVWGRGNG